jgi:hypothetical protein
MLGKQFTCVISTLDAFFTKVKGPDPLSAWFAKYIYWMRTRPRQFVVETELLLPAIIVLLPCI